MLGDLHRRPAGPRAAFRHGRTPGGRDPRRSRSITGTGVILDLDSGEQFRYRNSRRLGFIRVVTRNEFADLAWRLGPDPLEAPARYLGRSAARRDGADQGAAARPVVPRRRRQHLRGRSAARRRASTRPAPGSSLTPRRGRAPAQSAPQHPAARRQAHAGATRASRCSAVASTTRSRQLGAPAHRRWLSSVSAAVLMHDEESAEPDRAPFYSARRSCAATRVRGALCGSPASSERVRHDGAASRTSPGRRRTGDRHLRRAVPPFASPPA